MDLRAWILASISTFIGVILAAASGTGGGALYMPAYLFIFRDAHRAVPLAKVTIFGLSFSSFLLNIRKRHPHSNRPLIDFDIAAILEPPTLIGAVFGVFANLLLPSKVLMVMLIIVLCLVCGKTFTKGLNQFREESEAIALEQKEVHFQTRQSGTFADDRSPRTSDIETNLRTRSGTRANARLSGGSAKQNEEEMLLLHEAAAHPPTKRNIGGDTPVSQSSRRSFDNHSGVGYMETVHDDKSLLFPISGALSLANLGRNGSLLSLTNLALELFRVKEEPTFIHWPPFLLLVLVWIINFLGILYAGGPHALACGDAWQRTVVIFVAILLCTVTVLYALRLYNLRQREKDTFGMVDDLTDDTCYEWVTVRGLILYPLTAFLAGICAGALGIGGGLIKGPLLIAIGLDPMAAVTSALYMILFTSTTTTLSFALSGRLELLPSVWFFMLAALSGVLGNWLVNWMVKKFRRSSVITLGLASVIFVSMCCTIFSVLYDEHVGSTAKALTLDDACQYLHMRHSAVPLD